MLNKEFYKGREQAFVKHFVLENYLEKLAFKIGMSGVAHTLNYVDGFAGPWQHADQQLRDTSPFIAMDRLRQTKTALESKGRQFTFRCLFVEKEAIAFNQLEAAALTITDVEVQTRHGEFEDLIREAAIFAASGSKPFGFFFIDPTGWTGYPMSKLQPIFKSRHSELLINFMTSFIDRFVEDERPEQISNFEDLFGDKDYRRSFQGLNGLDREDAIVEAYCRRLKAIGSFYFVGSAIILDPNSDQTCYHLVYATHHPEGMRVFRKIEAKAHAEQENTRSEVAQVNRMAKSGVRDLFNPDVLSSSYGGTLTNRYQSKAKSEVVKQLREINRVSYDEIERTALAFPLTSSNDLNRWIAEWVSNGNLKLEGLKGKERVPKPDKMHFLNWQ